MQATESGFFTTLDVLIAASCAACASCATCPVARGLGECGVSTLTRQTRQPVLRHCYCPLRIHTPYTTPCGHMRHGGVCGEKRATVTRTRREETCRKRRHPATGTVPYWVPMSGSSSPFGKSKTGESAHLCNMCFRLQSLVTASLCQAE